MFATDNTLLFAQRYRLIPVTNHAMYSRNLKKAFLQNIVVVQPNTPDYLLNTKSMHATPRAQL